MKKTREERKVSGQTKESIYEPTKYEIKAWMQWWMNGWMNGWMKEWMNEWMKEWMNEWMSGWVSRNRGRKKTGQWTWMRHSLAHSTSKMMTNKYVLTVEVTRLFLWTREEICFHRDIMPRFFTSTTPQYTHDSHNFLIAKRTGKYSYYESPTLS